MKQRDDIELIARFLAGDDRGALDELFERHRSSCYGLALHLTRSVEDAEDVCQETAVRAIRHLEAFEPTGSFRSWLLRITTNVATDLVRSREARKSREERHAAPPDAVGRPDECAERSELAARVRAALATVQPRYRMPVVLIHELGLDAGEAAEVLGMSRSAVRTYASRGLEKIRARLARAGQTLAPAAIAGLIKTGGGAELPASLVTALHGLVANTVPLPKGAAAGFSGASAGAAKGGIVMKILAGAVLAGALAAGAALTMPGAPAAVKALPPPPFEWKWLPGWKVEHVAFTWGNAGKPLGGPARWAVGGGCVSACYPADHEESGRLYFVDKRRQIWLMDGDQLWPIAGTGDLGHANGPAEYAQFCGGGVYGGGISGVVGSGYTAYISDGGLRKISRGDDGRWKVELVGGSGKKTSLAPGETASFADLTGIRQLTGDSKGNLYFVLGGGLARATPDGKVSMIISREKVNADLTAVYAKKWPDAAKPGPISLGSGEGCSLIVGADGAIYGGGRTWPSAWKVTPDGAFVPLVNYAPKDKMVKDRRWGTFEPACYEPHCCMGFGVTSEGHVLTMNEIPWALSRSEFDKNQVTVLLGDGTFATEGTPWRAPASFGLRPDGSHVCNAPGPFPSRSTWIRMRKEK